MCDMSAERNTPHFILLQDGGVGYAIQNDSLLTAEKVAEQIK